MPKILDRLFKIALGALIGVSLCGLMGLVAVFALNLPGTMQELGPPSQGLNFPQQVALGLYILANSDRIDQPVGTTGESIILQVEEGQSAREVVRALESSGLIDRGTLLQAYLRYRGLDRGIEAGEYQLSGEMTLRELALALQSANPTSLILTTIEGWRSEQIAERLLETGLGLSGDEFLMASRNIPLDFHYRDQIPPDHGLEGFLFPDTYHLTPDMDEVQLVRMMLGNFINRVGDGIPEAFQTHGLSLYQGVTLASIVEREAVVEEERALIASVFLNRLKGGMKLEADPTVQYVLGRQPDGSWWKSPLTQADLDIDSPYNTYLYPGLPPGPIANPGLASLEAVAYPLETNYLYFRATCDGSGRHLFAETFQQHLQNACP